MEIVFVRTDECKEVLASCYHVRRLLAQVLGRKLRGGAAEDEGSAELRRAVERFMSLITHHAGIPISYADINPSCYCRVRRLVNPPRRLEDMGVFDPTGEIEFPDVEMMEDEEEEDGREEDEATMNEIEEQPQEESVSLLLVTRAYFQTPQIGPMTLYQHEDAEVAEEAKQEKKEKEAPKETYYDRLLKLQREREETTEGAAPAEPAIEKEPQKRKPPAPTFDPMAMLEKRIKTEDE